MLHLHTFPSSLSCCFPKRRVLAGYSLNNCLPMNNSSCARNNMGTSVSTMVKTNSKNKFITSNFQPSFIHLGVSFSGHLLHSPPKKTSPHKRICQKTDKGVVVKLFSTPCVKGREGVGWTATYHRFLCEI